MLFQKNVVNLHLLVEFAFRETFAYVKKKYYLCGVISSNDKVCLMKNNEERSILLAKNLQGQLARAAYLLLRTGRPVYSKDILIKAFPEKDDKGCDGEDYYYLGTKKSKLSEAMNALKKEFEDEECGEIEERREGAAIVYQYTGGKDPLAYRLLKMSKEYYDFLKASIPIMPKELYAYMLGETDVPEIMESGQEQDSIVYYGNGFVQKHSNLIGELYDWISRKDPITFRYHNFNGKVFRVFISPHALKEYNGRWFLFGATKNKKTGEMQISQYALDRIASEIDYDKSEGSKYIEPEQSYYKSFFDERVGVSQTLLLEPCDIILRTNDAGTHGRMTTKTLHSSHETLEDFDEAKGYGKIKLHVGTTLELIAQILSQGDGLTVEGPMELRTILEDRVRSMAENYSIVTEIGN